MFKGMKNLEFFAKGHRALVYTGFYKDRKVAVKVERKDSKAEKRINNEIKWLKILNKRGIGPKLLKYDKDYLIYEFVEGEKFLDWLKKADKKSIKKILNEIFKQIRILDKLKVNKKELHNPVKHILIDKKAVMIDFERCYKAEKPKNVTQFCQFLISGKVLDILKEKGFKIDKKRLIENLKKYKNKQNEKNFQNVISSLL